MSSSRARSMSPGRPLRTQKSPYHSQQLQQQHLAQLQQLQQLNQRYGSSSSSFSSSSSHTPTQTSPVRHSVYGTQNYASSDISFSNQRSVSQPTLVEPTTTSMTTNATPTTSVVPDRYRRRSMVNLPSHERSPSLPSTASIVQPAPSVQPSYPQSTLSTTSSSPPPRLSYSSTDSSVTAPSTTGTSSSSYHKKTHSRSQSSPGNIEDDKKTVMPPPPPPQPQKQFQQPPAMVLPSDARRKSLIANKDSLGLLQDQRASVISLSSYHTVQSHASPTRSMISDDSERESTPDSEPLSTVSQNPPSDSEVTTPAETIIPVVSNPVSLSNYDLANSQYSVKPVDDADDTVDGNIKSPASDRGRYRAKNSPRVSEKYSQQQPSHQQTQRTMSLSNSSSFSNFDQPLYVTKSNMSVGGKSMSGVSISGMSTQSSFSGLRPQRSSRSLREKFKRVFSFGKKSPLSNDPTGVQPINLTPGYASRERTSTMTSTTSGRSFSEFLRQSSSKASGRDDDAKSVDSSKSSSSFAALRRVGRKMLNRKPSVEQAQLKSSPHGGYSTPLSRTSTNVSHASTLKPTLTPRATSSFQPGLSPPKNTTTSSLSVSPAEVDRKTSQWSAGTTLEGVLNEAEPPVTPPVATPSVVAPVAVRALQTDVLQSGGSSPAPASPCSGSGSSDADVPEFVAAETVFPKHLGAEDIDHIRTSLDRTKSLERRGSRRRKVTPDSQSHHSHVLEEAVPNPTEVHIHHPNSSLGRSDSTSTPRGILKKKSDGSMTSGDTITLQVEQAEIENEIEQVEIEKEVEQVNQADQVEQAEKVDQVEQAEKVEESSATETITEEVEMMLANFSSISTDLDLSFTTQLEPLGLPVRPPSPTPSYQSSVRSNDSVARFATKLKDNLFKRKEPSALSFTNESISETDGPSPAPEPETVIADDSSNLAVVVDPAPETASIISTEAPSLAESFRSEGSYSSPVPPQIPTPATYQRGNTPLRHFSPGPTPSTTSNHNRRFSGGYKVAPNTIASRRYHQHGRSASYSDHGTPGSSATSSPSKSNFPGSATNLHAPLTGHVRKGNVSFSSRIVIYDTWDSDDYDRRTEPATCNRLTPLLAQQIKEELNNFKMNMDVHHESRIYTHFF